jgi:hypothetical protein
VRRTSQITSLILRAALCVLLLSPSGCGGGSGAGVSMLTQNPVTVFLPISTVVVSQNGMQVVVPIQIKSTSETALVTVGGLPGGVQDKYASSDTNPSGTLAFTATSTAPVGTYMPIITVISAGQSVATTFTLVVKMT